MNELFKNILFGIFVWETFVVSAALVFVMIPSMFLVAG